KRDCGNAGAQDADRLAPRLPAIAAMSDVHDFTPRILLARRFRRPVEASVGDRKETANCLWLPGADFTV
ncbi:MAG TPA: hypothetical protein VFV70_10910, partial [Hyphomonadaceae bacterium]|nr:hypothetical protein [Hyphomonadaceae bacterium]